MTVYYIGTDVHSGSTTFYCGDDKGKLVVRGTIPTNPQGVEQMLKRIQKKVPKGTDYKLTAGMETGNSSFRLAKIFSRAGIEVHVLHAKEVRDKVRDKKKKTDNLDAKEIYEGMRRQYYYKEVYIPTDAELKIRWLYSKRVLAMKTRTSYILSAKGTLRSWGFVEYTKRKLESKNSWNKLLKELESMSESEQDKLIGWQFEGGIGEDLIEAVKNDYEMWKHVDKLITDYERKIEEASKGLDKSIMKSIENVDDIFGIGRLSAVMLAVLIGDPHRFQKSNQLKSYFGLAPSENSSGGKVSRGKITKTGNGVGRKILVEIAQQATRSQHPLYPLFWQIRSKKPYNVAIAAVAGKLIQIVWRILRDGTLFDISRLGVCMVKVPSKTSTGRETTKITAVKKRRLPKFLAEHNLDEDAVIEIVDKELERRRKKKTISDLSMIEDLNEPPRKKG